MFIPTRVCFLLCLSFVCTVNLANAQISTIGQAASVEKLKAVSQHLAQMQQQIPQHYLSPEALAESNDYEPEKIVSWIKQNIQFSASPGYQLSPQSALRTATGNALEQAVLLQNVLVQAGLEVRLATATLSTDQATTLLRESFIPSPAQQWQLDPSMREESFKQLSRLLGSPEGSMSNRYASLSTLTPWSDSPVYKEAKQLALDFSAAIKKNQPKQTLPSNNLLQPWINNAQDYYFVKYRFSQGEPWKEAHPAFSVTEPVITNSSYHNQRVEKQHHTVSLQAFITRKNNGKTETIPVSALHKTSTAELFEQQLQFVTIPSGMHKVIEDRSKNSLESGQFFAVSINGELAKGARYFTTQGRDYSPDELSKSEGKIGVASKKGVEQFAERLDNGLGKESQNAQPNPQNYQLTHYYIEVTWAAPNGHKRSLHRTIYREHASQSSSQILAAITQSAILAATPAALTPAAELNSGLDTMSSAFALFAKLQSEQYSESQTLKQLSEWSGTINNLLFNSAVKLSEESVGGARLFSHAPVIALKWEQHENTASQGVISKGTYDYLINASQVAVINDDMLQIDPSRTLNYGVWSTYSEAILFADAEQRNSLSEQATSAAHEFNKAIAQQQFSIVNASSLKVASSLNSSIADSPLAKHIKDNPDYVFLVPTSASQVAPVAYYRVHPITGETLGYTLDGRGSVNASRVIAQNIFAIHSVFTVGKIIQCLFKETGGATCVGCTMLSYVISAVAFLATGNPYFPVVAGGTQSLACGAL